MSFAASEVTDELMNGTIYARGRSENTTKYEGIDKDVWRLAYIRMRPDKRNLWRGEIMPRWNIDPSRISALTSYDSIIINSREFEKLWPKTDKICDQERKKLLRQARRLGADSGHIKALRDNM